MTRIDHAAEARRLQGGARDIVRAINGDPALQPHMAAIIMLDDARLEAQLALVEQQRIANLIALSTPQELIGGGEASVPSWSVEPKTGWKNIGQQEIKLRPEIAAALGLTAGQEGEPE